MVKWLIIGLVLWYIWNSTNTRDLDELTVRGASLPPDPPMY